MSIDRLHKLQAANAIKGAEMMLGGGRFAALSSRHQDGTAPRAVSAFNLFQAPEHIAERMAAMLPSGADSILEPSAGLGRLYLAALKRFPAARFTLVESSADCMAELYRITEGRTRSTLIQGDYLARDLHGVKFDAIIMNPPFQQGRDIKHIQHAREMLNTGGVLVSLCYDGARQNEKLRPQCDSWEVLPDGTFRREGTCAGVVLLTARA